MTSDGSKNPETGLASQHGASNFKFEREDWTSFRTLEGLQQKAGVPKDRLIRLVLKELIDNALDADATARAIQLGDHRYRIEDNGPGLDGTPEEIARLFSIARPMVSTKLLRLPTRGALGNGLRVVAGVVLASEGNLVVSTRNQQITLRPERDGTTSVVDVRRIKHPVGTRIEIGFGPALASDPNALVWAYDARALAEGGRSYTGKSSPHWYDLPHFMELLHAGGDRPVRELISHLDGCSGAKAGEIVSLAGLSRSTCREITPDQAERLLTVARRYARPVRAKRLGEVGPDVFDDTSYAIRRGQITVGSAAPHAVIPQRLRLRASPHSRAGAQRPGFLHLGEHHDAAHADHE